MAQAPGNHGSKPGKTGKRHRAVKTNRMTLAKKIARDARTVAQSESPEAYGRMCDSIMKCLESGNENVLEESLQHTSDAPDAFQELEMAIHLLATSASGLMDPDTGSLLETELIAIPVMLGLSSEQYDQTPARLSDDDLNWLATSFRHHGLKHPTKENVMVLPELWLAEQVYNWPIPAVYRLTQACNRTWVNDCVPDAGALLKSAPIAASIRENTATLCLRYVLVAFLHQEEEEMPFLLDENEEKLEQWQEAAAEHLEDSMNCHVQFYDPEPLYDALASGWVDYHLVGQRYEREQLFEKAGVLPAEVTAVMSFHGKDGVVNQIRIGYYRPMRNGPECIGGSVWAFAPFDNASEVIDLLLESLKDEQLGKVEVIEDFQEESYRPDSGEPIYMRPESDMAPISIIKPADPKHMH